MNLVVSQSPAPRAQAKAPALCRNAAAGKEPTIFTRIYQQTTNIAIWQRDLSAQVQGATKELLATNPDMQTAMTVTPQSVFGSIRAFLGSESQSALSTDIAGLVDMFCCLFDLTRVGLRLTALNRAMCPRFHVDRVPCRLITTYQGAATEWLPHAVVDRTKLGARSDGVLDSHSGLYGDAAHIQKLSNGDVALLKGELWEHNENAGLVHRSPAVPAGENRLLLTLDFSD